MNAAGPECRRSGQRLRPREPLRHLPLPDPTDEGRVATPFLGTENGVAYMFHEVGPRLRARICIACQA